MSSGRQSRPSLDALRAATLGSLLMFAAAVQASPSLKEQAAGGVTIDWQAGTLTASGGAAADLRMPTVDLARPGAVRRAHGVALEKLRGALAELPLGAGKPSAAGRLAKDEIDRALGRARTLGVEYQSNGGAVIQLEVRFGDWLDPPGAEPAVTLSVPAMHLGAAPTVRVGEREVRLGAATYRSGAAPAAAKATTAKLDAAGRLVVGDAKAADKLARAVALIYVHKVSR